MGNNNKGKTNNKKNNNYHSFLPSNYISQMSNLPNISVTKEGAIVYANEDSSRVLGYSKKDLLGMEAASLYVNPLDRDLFLKELYEKGKIENYKLALKRKDGREVECNLDLCVFKDSEGNVLGHTGTVKDIHLETDYRLKLQKENEKLFSILEKLPFYVCLFDENRNIVFANKQLIDRFHIPKKNKCYSIFYDKDEPCENCEISEAFETNKPLSYEKLQKDGKICEIHIYPFKDVDGNRLVLEIGKDISHRKRTEEKLTELNDTLIILNKILKHDILNDLTVALNFCDLIATEDEDIKERVMNSIYKCVQLIETTRDFEKTFSEVGSSNDIKFYDLKDKLSELTKYYSDVQINIFDDCKVLTDGTLMIAFDNIIRNAKRHGKAEKIDISFKRKGKYCEVSFADDGKGVPDELKSKLFDEGFGYGLNKGSGLGLYIAKKIIEKYDGEISVADNKPKGSVFTLKFKSEVPNEIC